MPYNNLISRTDAAALIPEEVSNEMLKATRAVRRAAAVHAASRWAQPGALPVLSALPIAYCVTGDTGLKQTTEVNWANKFLNIEEIAAIVPVPEAVLDDADRHLGRGPAAPRGGVRPRPSTPRSSSAPTRRRRARPTSSPPPSPPATPSTAAPPRPRRAASSATSTTLLGTSRPTATTSTGFVAAPRPTRSSADVRDDQGDAARRDRVTAATASTASRSSTRCAACGRPARVGRADRRRLRRVRRRRPPGLHLQGARPGRHPGQHRRSSTTSRSRTWSPLRVMFRVGWQVANTINYDQPTEAHRYPAAHAQLLGRGEPTDGENQRSRTHVGQAEVADKADAEIKKGFPGDEVDQTPTRTTPSPAHWPASRRPVGRGRSRRGLRRRKEGDS